MKIAYIASSEFGCPPPENQIQAALWVCSQIIGGMTKRGHQTVYVGVDGSTVKASEVRSMGKAFFDIYQYEEWVKLSILEKDQTLLNYQTKLQLFLLDILRETSVDLVHFNSSPPIFMLPFSAKISVPKIQTIHDPISPSYQVLFDQYSDINTNYFVSISNAQRIGAPKLQYADTVYNGISVDNYSFFDAPEKRLLFLGRIKKVKGVYDAIIAAKQAGFPLTIAGREAFTEQEYMEKEVNPLIDGKMISKVGVVGHEEKVQLLKSSSALLFPIQWQEPFGLVMVEAMASGTPVIAYNRGSVPEILRDGLTGFIIDPDNENRPGKGGWIIKKQGVEGLVEAVKRIGEIDRKACRKHVEDNFTIEQMVNNYERVYKEILSENRG